jgi:GT2 family glycosyltransferase
MIPTYNCARHLAHTLQTLQCQTISIDKAQIEVVDDDSNSDDPAAIVRRTENDRIRFHRLPQHRGKAHTFNACIDRAEREWLHILPGDGWVLPNAYEVFSKCIDAYPEALAVFVRCQIVNDAGDQIGESELIGPEQRGLLRYTPQRWRKNPLRYGSVLLSRRAVAAVGKFDADFFHVNDWNYWWRVARAVPVAYTNTFIGAQRRSGSNLSSSLIKAGTDLKEHIGQIRLMIETDSQDPRYANLVSPTLYREIYATGLTQCSELLDDQEALTTNLNILQQVPAAGRGLEPLLRFQVHRFRYRFGARLTR